MPTASARPCKRRLEEEFRAAVGVRGYSFATEPGSLLGHRDVATTMIYTHVLKVGGGAVRSPMDSMLMA